MVTDRLAHFLGAYCNPDDDPDETAAILRNPAGAGIVAWLPGALSEAIRAGDLTPARLTKLTGIGFDTPAEVDAWLRGRWESWFDQPYPA